MTLGKTVLSTSDSDLDKEVVEESRSKATVRPIEASSDLAQEDPRLFGADAEGDNEDLDRALPSVRAAVMGKSARLQEDGGDEGDGGIKTDNDFDFSEDFSEAQGPRVQRRAVAPPAEEIKRHKVSGHCPYRSWCEDCIRGAATMDPHLARGDPISNVPEFHSDYAFFRDRKGDKLNKVVVLVSRDRGSLGLAAHVVPKKRTGSGWIIGQYERDLRKFGHRTKITLRSDGEPAIVDLLRKVGEAREAETLLEQSPGGDSKANGRAEQAVQTVEKATRVIKISTERNLGSRIRVTHPAFPWMVMHAADMCTKCQVHR